MKIINLKLEETNMLRKDMSIATKKKLAKLLTHTGETEQRIEFCRQNLCKA